MDSLWAQLVLQLGISGLIVFAGFKIGMMAILKWREAESEKNKAYATAEEARTRTIADGFRADIDGHNAIVDALNEHTKWNARLEGKIDAVLDLTPVRGIREPEMPKRRTPVEGVPVARTPIRPKTGGENR